MTNFRLTALALVMVLLATAALQRAAANDPTDMYDKPDTCTVVTTGGTLGYDNPGLRPQNYGQRTNQTVTAWLRGNNDAAWFLAALDAVDLTKTFDGTSSYTVFVPSNAAFTKLPKGTWEALLLPENKELLKQVLNYHYTAGNLTTGELAGRERIQLNSGDVAGFRDDNGQYTIANASITQPDVIATNGTVEVIDTVLLPPSVVTQLEGKGFVLSAYADLAHPAGIVMSSSQTRSDSMNMDMDKDKDMNTSGSNTDGKCGGTSNSSDCGGNNCGCNSCGGRHHKWWKF